MYQLENKSLKILKMPNNAWERGNFGLPKIVQNFTIRLNEVHCFFAECANFTPMECWINRKFIVEVTLWVFFTNNRFLCKNSQTFFKKVKKMHVWKFIKLG